jgi:hypothetical protein
VLNPGLGARFANLAMNAATAYEQSRMLALFMQAHPQPKSVIIVIDQQWCSAAAEPFTSRAFPEWMYRRNLWPAYREMLTPYAVQEAANQFAVMIGWKQRRYGLDGYTDFLPPESAYDPVRRDALFAQWPPLDSGPEPVGMDPHFPAMTTLEAMVRTLPSATRLLLVFSPIAVALQGEPGSAIAWRWAGCKREVTRIAQRSGALALDFAIPSRITADRNNYWDPVHYREAVARHLMESLIAGSSSDAATLNPGR